MSTCEPKRVIGTLNVPVVFIFYDFLHNSCIRRGEMYYKRLAHEYLSEAKILKKHIKSIRTQYVKIGEEQNPDVNCRLRILYSMYLDLLHTGKYLKRKSEVTEE